MIDTNAEPGNERASGFTEATQAPAPSTPSASSAGTSDALNNATADARHAATGLADQVRQRFAGAAADQKAGFADRLGEVADSLHKSSEQFSGKQDWIAAAIERGATELSSVAGSLRDADVGDLLQQVQSFARRQPGLFIGASFAAGVGLARFGKILAAGTSRDDLPTLPEVGHGQH
jgi:NADH dehydrogenase/NADH:ubiquinone oxidoreductase subunit G